MKHWLLIAGIVWVGPRLSPKEAAAILKPNEFRDTRCVDCTGPTVIIGPSASYPQFLLTRPVYLGYDGRVRSTYSRFHMGGIYRERR